MEYYEIRDNFHKKKQEACGMLEKAFCLKFNFN